MSVRLVPLLISKLGFKDTQVRNRAHRQLFRKLCLPTTYTLFLLIFCVFFYVEAVKALQTPLVGLLIPCLTVAMEVLSKFLLRRGYVEFYVEPKMDYLRPGSG